MNFTDIFGVMKLAAQQVLILYLMVAVGFVTDKTHLFTEKAALMCTDLLFFIITPAKIIESFLTLEYSPDTLKNLFIAIGMGLLMHAAAAVISTLSFRGGDKEKAAIYKYACAYGNCGYMGLPLTNALVGPQGVFYCSAVIISFQIFSFTHGITVMSKSGEAKKIDFKKIILNPGVIAVIIGLPFYLLNIHLPEIAYKPVEYIASLNTPLAMLMFGTYIAHSDFRSMFKNWRIPVVAVLKLLVLPAIMIALCKAFGFTGALLSTLVLTASVPPANNTVLFAAKYGRDTGLASQVVSAVSLMSIVTIPLTTGIVSAI